MLNERRRDEAQALGSAHVSCAGDGVPPSVTQGRHSERARHPEKNYARISFSDSRGDADPHRRHLFAGRGFEDALTVDIQEKPNRKKCHHQI